MPMMGFLLGVMCTSICEAPTTYVTVDNEYNVTPLETILEQSELKHNYAKSNNNETRKISCKKRQKMKYSGYMDIGILQKVNLIYEKRGVSLFLFVCSYFPCFMFNYEAISIQMGY
ncbi:unnamed protein product [Trichobilharzia regenti]|nr:unnamed protein product [Trichobilharzia regenti]